jgi:uncharacterized protein YdhG (YjbR/CyaY superfamily)
MRKAPSAPRDKAAKGDVDPKYVVDEYLAGIPEPARSTLSTVRATIRAAVPPEATESISYGMPMFKYKGVLVGFAAFTNHCGFYVTSPAVMEAFASELKDYDTSKGTIRFPLDKPLPTALVKKLVKARIAENENKKKR